MAVNVDQVNVTGTMLESEEAARRLGVKLATLYAYVSRGLLQSHPSPSSRRRLFVAEEVEALAKRARGGKQVETRFATITTAITQLRPQGPFYRGTAAVDLAHTSSFEQVAELLWESQAGNWDPLPLQPPNGLGSLDILRWTTVMAAAQDPQRNELHPELLTRRLRTLIATMSILSGPNREPMDTKSSGVHQSRIARNLTDGFRTKRRTTALVRAVDAALVLIADHELATSNLAVRIAASTRANIYDALLSGLGTMGGPLHGGASPIVTRMMHRAQSEGVDQVVQDVLASTRVLPGFGHSVYVDGDPRADALLEFVYPIASTRKRALITALLDAAEHRLQPPPNIDFALAALAFAADMPAESMSCAFTIGRVAGWGAHYLEEIQEPPLRYRARAIYSTGNASKP
ncbi:MAG: citrate synthase [Actinomycetota bacterium]|nr:citrate synthase [Actinomycetota bacterium]